MYQKEWVNYFFVSYPSIHPCFTAGKSNMVWNSQQHLATSEMDRLCVYIPNSPLALTRVFKNWIYCIRRFSSFALLLFSLLVLFFCFILLFVNFFLFLESRTDYLFCTFVRSNLGQFPRWRGSGGPSGAAATRETRRPRAAVPSAASKAPRPTTTTPRTRCPGHPRAA